MKSNSGIHAKDFPHLSEFARGYLHQDLIPEYGSALQATKSYLHDLGVDGRKKVAQEAFQFRSAIRDLSAAETNDAIERLGASWTFIYKDELEQVLQMLERGR